MIDESLIVLRNISASLMEHEKRHFYSIEKSDIGVWEFDLINKKLFWDSTMFKIYDKNKECFSGEYIDWAMSVHKDDLNKSEKRLKDCAEGITNNFESIFRVLNNNRWRIVIAQGIAKRDRAGTIISVVEKNHMIPIELENNINL